LDRRPALRRLGPDVLAHPFDILWSFLFVVVAAFVHPTFASCPKVTGWMLDGVRTNGSFSCLHNAAIESDAPADAELCGRIYCPSDQQPVVGWNGVVVSCHAKH